MGREVRRVPLDFEWALDVVWDGFINPYDEGEPEHDTWTETPPPAGDAWQMWESTSEGSPMPPPFATPEALATWLADTGASSFGYMTATREQWLAMIHRGSAPSAIIVGGRLKSGVSGVDL